MRPVRFPHRRTPGLLARLCRPADALAAHVGLLAMAVVWMAAQLRPGVHVTRRAARNMRGIVSDTGTWFVAGLTERGVTEPQWVTSLDAFTRRFGPKVHYSTLPDAAEVFFAEGGGRMRVARVVGPGAAPSTVTLVDRHATAPADTLRVDAIAPGSYGDTLSVRVTDATAPGTFTIDVLDGDDVVETFADLDSPTAAVDALAGSDHVRGTDLASATAPPDNNPATGTFALAGGTDDRANITDDDWQAALDRFDRDDGPGQVSQPGRTTTEAHAQLVAHAVARNRTAYLDAPDGSSSSQLVTLGDQVNSPVAGFFGSWVMTPSQRAVPGAAFAAAVTSRLDAAAGSAGFAPAGAEGTARYVTDVTRRYTAEEISEAFAAGVNLVRAHDSRGVQLYGFRSTSSDRDWRQLTAGRLAMSIEHRSDALGDRMNFRNINAKTLADFEAGLRDLISDDWRAGALATPPGADPGDPDNAFDVDVGPAVNTPETIANEEIRAVVSARFAPHAELVRIDLVKQPVA